MDTRILRNVLGCYPTGVSVVTTADECGTPIGVTVNSFASVSLDPPLILWSLSRRSRSLPAFQHALGFSVNILASDQQDLSARFARGGSDKWANVDYRNGRGGFPNLTNSVAVLDCESSGQSDGGDHVIFLGRIIGVDAEPDRAPLVFHLGRYRDLTNERPLVRLAKEDAR
jgi:flavin reductase (DIM6/NTAB) family NADH-FMN oxidoreductase RutF